MTTLLEEVDRFRAWAAEQPQGYGEWEIAYEAWPELLSAVEQSLSKPDQSESEQSALLYALARDNECENILELLVQYPRAGMHLAQTGLQRAEPEARWQLAVFLGQQVDAAAGALLERLLTDQEKYVRRRALLACCAHWPNLAEATAVRWITEPDAYARKAALSVLRDVQSPEFDYALGELRDDPSVIVRKAVRDLEREV